MSPLDDSMTGSIEAPDMETVEQLQRTLLETFAALRRDGMRASEPVWEDSQEARRRAFGVAEVLEFTAELGPAVVAEVLSEYLERELRGRFPNAHAEVYAEESAVTVRVLESTIVIRLSRSESQVTRTYS